MRRKKKIILNIAKILIVVLIAVGIYFIFFNKQKKIEVANTTSNGRKLTKQEADESNIRINLPEVIRNYTTNEIISKDEKTFSPLARGAETYLIPTLIYDKNEVTILVGDDSENLLSANSPIQIGNEYTVSGIEETIAGVYYFTIEDYEYPILLLLGQSAKLYYVDTQRAYSTGNFAINGYIENIPDVQTVESRIKAVKDEKTSPSAVIVCTNGEGYEFSTDMIGR